MSLTNAIFRNGVFIFALIPLFAVWGFWLTYFTGQIRPISAYDHFHGIAMFGCCLMLIVQSGLIRTNRRDIHRQVGKLSYVLALLIVISTLLLANFQLNFRGMTDEGLFVLALQIPLFFAIKSTLWRAFANGYMSLPLT